MHPPPAAHLALPGPPPPLLSTSTTLFTHIMLTPSPLPLRPAPQQPVFQRCLAKGILAQADVAAMALAFIARLPELVDENAKAPGLVARCLGALLAPANAPVADMAKALRDAGGGRAYALVLLCTATWCFLCCTVLPRTV
jgi:hypothetical protein